MPTLVLASSSRYRRELLARFGLPLIATARLLRQAGFRLP